jgi:energy-coupling factor transport system ATP-binding protein
MDGDARAMMARVVSRLRDAGAAVVMATHDSELAAEVGDRIVRLDGGRASDLGPPQLALKASRPGATDVAKLYPGGPVTVEGVLRCL